jgi:hypothetical protein
MESISAEFPPGSVTTPFNTWDSVEIQKSDDGYDYVTIYEASRMKEMSYEFDEVVNCKWLRFFFTKGSADMKIKIKNFDIQANINIDGYKDVLDVYSSKMYKKSFYPFMSNTDMYRIHNLFIDNYFSDSKLLTYMETKWI